MKSSTGFLAPKGYNVELIQAESMAILGRHYAKPEVVIAEAKRADSYGCGSAMWDLLTLINKGSK